VLGLIVSIALAACSSSASSKSGGSDPNQAGSGATIEVGLPYVLQTTSSTPTPEIAFGADVAVKWINDHGGIQGHKVKVDKCDDHFTATAATTCMRGFANNKKLLAVVGGSNCFSDASAAILKSSGLPWLAPSGCGANSYTSPQFTAVNGGVVGDAHALGNLVGSQKLAGVVITFNLPQADVIVNGITDAAKAAGGSIVGAVRVDPSTADMTAAVSTALQEHPQAVIPQTSAAQTVATVQALKQQGYTGKIVVAASQVSATTLASLGSAAGQIVGVTSGAPVMAPDANLPALKQFRAEMAAAGAKDSQITSGSFTTWLTYHEFYDAANKAATLDRAGVLAAAKSLTGWSYQESNPPMSFAAPGPLAGFPNIVMHWSAMLTVANNKWVWDGKWVDFAPTS
jgi:ABC-type branched-subunit amino acid transport system substrate-binding protein